MVATMGWLVCVAGCDGSPSSLASDAGATTAPAKRAESAPRNADSSQTSPPDEAPPTTPPPVAPGRQSSRQSSPSNAAPKDDRRLREITFDDLQFEMEVGERFEEGMLTPEVKALFGQRVRIRGYILPTLRKRGLTQFVLVRDNMECCFGPGAALYDCILVTMAADESTEYTIRPVAVEGLLDFEEHAPLGETLAIFKMTGYAVE